MQTTSPFEADMVVFSETQAGPSSSKLSKAQMKAFMVGEPYELTSMFLA